MDAHVREPKLDRKTKTALIVFLVGVIASVVGLATWSAYSSTTSNTNNQFQTGSVVLSDNDSGTAMFNMTGARPGDTVSKCITVTYTGTLTSNVTLYGTGTAGNGLDAYLDLKVTRGGFSSNTPANMACSDGGTGSTFQPDSVTYSGGNGAGANGVLFNARMNLYPTSWATGILDAPGGTAEAWTNPEPHVYKFEVTVANDNNGANKNHTQTFTWEARDA
jgi:predicted ribosomally synthesized peptide with SipW-like signal peptide